MPAGAPGRQKGHHTLLLNRLMKCVAVLVPTQALNFQLGIARMEAQLLLADISSTGALSLQSKVCIVMCRLHIGPGVFHHSLRELMLPFPRS